jgi:hypothetical protein
MLQIDFNSATMTFEPEGSRPATSASDRFVSTHLTQGFTSADAEAKSNGVAFHIRGEVDVLADSQADLDDIVRGRRIFNFIQILRINERETTWSGRTPNEGEVSFVVVPPVPFSASQRVSLDSDSSDAPFMNSFRPTVTVSGKTGQRIKAHVVARMGDHPSSRMLLSPPQNRITRSPNFLRKSRDDREFFSVFVARDDKGVLQPALAHIRWRLAFNLQVKWAKGKPKPELVSPIFQFDPFVKGSPADPEIKAVLNNPVPPFSNDVTADLQKKGVLSDLHLRFSARRSLLVRNDFFT